jgi:anti-sigma regulatory factor (Ser/Thr protein kinase)
MGVLLRSCRTLSPVAVVGKHADREREALVLVAAPVAVSEARAWLTGLAAGIVDGVRLPDLELAFSEVVTNAVRHGQPGGEILLAATPKPEFLCVQVTDEGAGFVPHPRAMMSDENGGFGLFLVERLTRRWGITREDMRTRVWFEFDYA